jgi:chemotaxis protein methyltransferase CheR
MIASRQVMMSISDGEFSRFRGFIYSNFGINLTEEKKTLVVGRMQKYLRENSFDTFSKYLDWLEANPTADNLSELVNRISTNHTYFYREPEHFDYMNEFALPEIDKLLSKEKSKDLRIWCAAAATGEEPYTIVTSLMEYYGNEYNRIDAGLLATDISTKALGLARQGVYSEEKFYHTSEAIKNKYFNKLPDGQHYKVVDKVRKEVLFKRLNLMRERFPFKKKFHIIFCRNVMIYFDKKTRDNLVQKLYDNTIEGGYLFVGHSETLQRSTCPYKYVKPAIYQKV